LLGGSVCRPSKAITAEQVEQPDPLLALSARLSAHKPWKPNLKTNRSGAAGASGEILGWRAVMQPCTISAKQLALELGSAVSHLVGGATGPELR